MEKTEENLTDTNKTASDVNHEVLKMKDEDKKEDKKDGDDDKMKAEDNLIESFTKSVSTFVEAGDLDKIAKYEQVISKARADIKAANQSQVASPVADNMLVNKAAPVEAKTEVKEEKIPNPGQDFAANWTKSITRN